MVEDAAQALGSTFKGKHAETFGNASAISFFPQKLWGLLVVQVEYLQVIRNYMIKYINYMITEKILMKK